MLSRDDLDIKMETSELEVVLSNSDFDSNAFLSSTINSINPSGLLKSITDVLKSMDSSIFQHVASHHRDLLKMATEVDHLHDVLQSVEDRILILSQSMEKLKKKLDIPYEALQTTIRHFRRLQVTTDLLRKIVRSTVLIKRLQSRTLDLTKLSLCVNELEHLFSVMDWEGIHILETYKRVLDQSREDMISQAWGLINNSFETKDQIHLGLGLQIAQNLGLLPEVISELITRWKTDFNSTLANALDVTTLGHRARSRQSTAPSGPGRATGSTIGGQAAAFYVALWTSLDGLMDKIDSLASNCRLLGSTLVNYEAPRSGSELTPVVQLEQRTELYSNLAELLLHYVVSDWHKQQALRDSVVLLFSSITFPSLIAVSDPSKSINDHEQNGESQPNLSMYFNELETQLKSSNGFVGWAFTRLDESLSTATEQSSQIKEALDGEFPKLLKLVLDLGRRVRQAHWDRFDQLKPNEKQTDLICFFELPDYMLRTLRPFETAYLSRSLSRLFDQVSMAFSTQATVDSSMIDGIVQSAVSELAFATVHRDLLYKVSRNVAKTVALFTSKVESLVSVGPTAVQVTDTRNPSQANNINLINLLCTFGRQLETGYGRRLRNLPVLQQQSATENKNESPFDVVHDALDKRLNALCLNILQPLLESITEHVEELLAHMHSECYCPSANEQECDGAQQSCSNSIKQLQEFILRTRRQYLSNLSQPPSNLPPTALSLPSSVTNSDSTGSGSGRFSGFICGEMALQVALRPVLVRWVDVFLHNLSLVRPVNEVGCLRLAADCAEFELALAPILSTSMNTTLANLAPEAYHRLKAFRPLLLKDSVEIVELFTTPNESTDSDIKCLSPSLVCQHLFSRAPDEIRSVHDTVGWSTSRYITWTLDRMEESERLSFLRNGLAVYVREVQMRQQREYAPAYVLLKKFLSHFDEQMKKKTENVTQNGS